MTRTTDLLAAATVFPTGRDVPSGHRVSRCIRCERHFAWKGAAPRPGCPICPADATRPAGALTTTTRSYRGSFTLLEGELLTIAELKPQGLAAAARWETSRADDFERRQQEARDRVVAGEGVSEDGYRWRVYYPFGPDRPFVQSEWPKGSGTFGSGGSSLPVDLSDSIAKARAKAAKYEARRAKLAAAVESAGEQVVELVEAGPAPVAQVETVIVTQRNVAGQTVREVEIERIVEGARVRQTTCRAVGYDTLTSEAHELRALPPVEARRIIAEAEQRGLLTPEAADAAVGAERSLAGATDRLEEALAAGVSIDDLLVAQARRHGGR